MKKQSALCTGDIVLTEDISIGDTEWPLFGIIGQNDASIEIFKSQGRMVYIASPVHCLPNEVVTYDKSTHIFITTEAIKTKVGISKYIYDNYEESMNDIFPKWKDTNLRPLEDHDLIMEYMDIIFKRKLYGDVDISEDVFYQLFMRHMSSETAKCCLDMLDEAGSLNICQHIFNITGIGYASVIKCLKRIAYPSQKTQ